MNGREEVLDALLRERYGKSLWFRTRPENKVSKPIGDDLPSWDDSEATCARRRRHLVWGFKHDDDDESAETA